MKYVFEQPRNLNPEKQKGAVLIVALVILLVLTVLGVAIMESSVVEERMAGNVLDRNITFQAAEAALRAGEAEVGSWVSRPEPISGAETGKVATVDSISGGASWWARATNWSSTKANLYDVDGDSDVTTPGFTGTSQDPYYIIEEYDEVCDELIDPIISQCRIIYRVTAMAVGVRNSTVVLQSLYARRF